MLMDNKWARRITKFFSSVDLSLVVGKSPQNGIKIDQNSPHFGWRDLICGMDVRSGGPAQPILTNFKGGLYMFAFSPTEVQEAYANAHLDHDYVQGSVVFPHIHWTTNTASTGVVRWGFEYSYARRSDGNSEGFVFTEPQTLYVEQSASGVPDKHYVAESPVGISSSLLEPDTVIVFRIFRDAIHQNDTFPEPAFGFTFDLHYQSTGVGTKNKDPDFYS